MKKYYTVAFFDNGQWHVDFGDYDKEVVKQEIEDSYSDYKTKIITTTKGHNELMEKLAQLNKGASK